MTDACPASPCPSRPLRARIIILDAGGREVTTVDTDARGRFRVALPAGEYVVRGRSVTGAPPRASAEAAVRVPVESFASVTVDFESAFRLPATRAP